MKTKKSLIKKLDVLVSKIVRERDEKCVLCGSVKQLTAGHVFSRRNYSTRWSLDNVFAQCWGCNYKHGRDQYPYFIWYINKFGLDKLQSLRVENQKPSNFKIRELEQLYESLSINILL